MEKEAIAKAIKTMRRARRASDITNRGFPHQMYKPSKPRPTLSVSPKP